MAKKKQAEAVIVNADSGLATASDTQMPGTVPAVSYTQAELDAKIAEAIAQLPHALTDAEARVVEANEKILDPEEREYQSGKLIEKVKSQGFVVIPEADFAQLFNGLVTGNVLEWRGPVAVNKIGRLLGAQSAADVQATWEKFKAIDQKRTRG